MSVYEYTCDCKEGIQERLLPMRECDQPQTCKCGKVMLRKMSVSCPQPLSSSLRFTAEGKAAQGKEMALDSLNSRHGGFPSRQDDLRAKGIRDSVVGLEEPPKTIW